MRDNAVHFYNKPFDLRKKVHEFGTANIANYIQVSQVWFGADLTDYEFFLMPLAFINTRSPIKAIKTTSEEKLVVDYFRETQNKFKSSNKDDYSVSLNIEVNLTKGASPESSKLFKFSNSPDAKPVRMSEADFKERWPWNYTNLTKQLRKMIPGFKVSKQYHSIRKRLEKNPNLCKIRYLDPDNKKALGKNGIIQT